MQVQHTSGKAAVAKDGICDASFLLGNANGGYAYFSEGRRSRYEGAFFASEGKMMRVVAGLGLGGEATKIVNRLYAVERCVKGNKETFLLPEGCSSLAYELAKADWFDLALDVRGAYEPFGQTAYEVTLDGASASIRCAREGKEYFVHVLADSPEYQKTGEFRQAAYDRDRLRNSPPYEGTVYHALRARSKKMVVSFSDDADSAREEAEQVYSILRELKKEQSKSLLAAISKKPFASSDVWLAYLCCRNSLRQLTSKSRVAAGYPWFFQNWTRDELISIPGLSDELKKTIILRYLHHITEDGRVPNILPGGGPNADSVGWLFKRIGDNLSLFNNSQRAMIQEKLVSSIMRLNETHIRDFLTYNSPKETWMDTQTGGGRGGARIEIQALTLNMLRLASRLTRNDKFRRLEQITAAKVRSSFWDRNYLCDGSDDALIRPNVFLAAYAYPDLLTKEEWTACFDTVLQRLWCGWGGLASVDKKSLLYLEHSTDEDPRSYHNGDSWYYLNNIAALVLHRVDAKRYGKWVRAILDASTADVLWLGMVGHHSETSSAAEQTSGGCGAQAWSAATYAELVHGLFLE